MTAAGATMGAMAKSDTPYREATRQLLRETVFKAARDQLEDRAWSEMTMLGVAEEAGVSRQTLYNEFGSRDEFGVAFVMHEGGRFLDGVESAVRAHPDDPRAAVEAALEHFLRAAGDDPLIRILLSDDGTGGMLPFVTTQGMPVVVWAADRISAVIVETWPGVGEGDARLLSESLVRLAISYVTAPAGPPDETAAAAGRLLGPFVESTFSAAG